MLTSRGIKLEQNLEIPLKVVGFILAGYFLRLPVFEHFIFISNQRQDGRFEKSPWDVTFLFFYICVFTALRAATMDYVLFPLAKLVNVPKKKYQRFAEQSYSVFYYGIAFGFGVVSIGLILQEQREKNFLPLD